VKKVNKGTRGMPRLSEAMKDVISCDKLRGLANVSLYSLKPGLSVSQPREQIIGKFIGQVISCLPFRGKLFPEKIRK